MTVIERGIRGIIDLCYSSAALSVDYVLRVHLLIMINWGQVAKISRRTTEIGKNSASFLLQMVITVLMGLSRWRTLI